MFSYYDREHHHHHHRRQYAPVLVTGPGETPISPEEALLHCRIDAEDDDSLVEGLIDAATANLDGWFGRLGQCLITQTWLQHYNRFEYHLYLPLDPVQSISGVTYLDTNNVEQTVANTNYQLLHDELGPYVQFNWDFAFPDVYQQGPAVSVTYVVGFGTAEDVPQAIKQAMFLMIATWYKNRESVLDGFRIELLPGGVDALLMPFTRPRF